MDLPIKDYVLRAANKQFEVLASAELNSKKSGKILDIGCGTGERSLKFSSNSWSIVGIDIAKNAILIAQEKEAKYCRYEIMDTENMDFEDDQFDLVFNYGTFSSLDISKALPDIVRVLKPDGSLIITESLGNN